MLRSLSIRFWLEAVLGACSAIAFLLSLIVPQWIEVIFEQSPDAGDGSSEWGVTLALFVVTVVLAWLARTDWRRAGRQANTLA